MNTRSLKIRYWLICHWRYGHINIDRKFESPGVGAFKWKTIEVGTKTNDSSLGFPAEQIRTDGDNAGGGGRVTLGFCIPISSWSGFSMSRAHLWPPHPWLEASIHHAWFYPLVILPMPFITFLSAPSDFLIPLAGWRLVGERGAHKTNKETEEQARPHPTFLKAWLSGISSCRWLQICKPLGSFSIL